VPASCEARVALPAGVDLHARPAGLFVKTAMRFRSRVSVLAGEREADAKSILAVLALGARGGTTVTLRAEGEDAAEALAALGGCITSLP
jgi:phosphocarrier protein HPr